MKLIDHPVLVWPDFSKKFTVVPDASGYAIGGVLCQDHGKGLQPIAYCSRKMLKAETRYATHEQELLAILYCCKKWRHYLMGDRVTVHTDHLPLKYLATQPNISNRQARWLDFLSEYDLLIEPQPGKNNIAADALSRRPDYKVNNLYSIIIGSEYLVANIATTASLHSRIKDMYVEVSNGPDDSNVETHTHLVCEGLTSTTSMSEVSHEANIKLVQVSLVQCTTEAEAGIYSEIQKSYREDTWCQPLITGAAHSIGTGHGKYLLLNQLIYYIGKDERYLLYIPANARLRNSKITLRQQLIQEAHDVLYAGHFGTAKTLHRLEEQFFWPQINLDVADYCTTCIPCQRNKPSNRKPLGLLQPIPIAWKPWSCISMDFITFLPKSVGGYDAIMVVVDQLTKRAHFIPTVTTASAASTAQLFFDEIWKYHGLPVKIISDRDSKFTSKFWSTLWKLLGTELAMSTAYSPQTDGQTERLNKTLEQYIRMYIDVHSDNWAQC